MKSNIEKFTREKFPVCYDVSIRPFNYIGIYVEDMIPICSIYIDGKFIGNVCEGGYADQELGAIPFFEELTKYVNSKR